MGVAGISIGVVGAAALSRFIGGFLYGVQPLEPAIYAWCAAGVLMVTGLASLLPALASRHLAPAAVLRED
jgi:hypothetical protein